MRYKVSVMLKLMWNKGAYSLKELHPEVTLNLPSLLQRAASLVGVSTLLLVALVIPVSNQADAVAPGVTVTVDCGVGDSPLYTSAGFTIPSRSIIPGLGNNGFSNRDYVSITTNDVLAITYRNCYSSFSTSYGLQEAAVFTEDCGTFSPTPTTGIVTGLTMTYTYTPLETPANSRTRAYCGGTGGYGSGDHIQYYGDLSPQLSIRVSVSVAESETTVPPPTTTSPTTSTTTTVPPPTTTSPTTSTTTTVPSTTTSTTVTQSGASGVTGLLGNSSFRLKVFKTASAKSIATFAKIKVLPNSKVSLKVGASTTKFCKVSGTSLKGLKVGTCKVAVTVTPKKGKAVSKTITLKVAK